MSKKPYVIILGNEKGGTGKSTTAMHVIAALLNMGYKVGSIDVDARQGTLSRYIENRVRYQKNQNSKIPLSTHISVQRNQDANVETATLDDKRRFDEAMTTLKDYDFIVVDTPGHDTSLARYAHSFADTLITPLNDSFIDLDVLANIDPETLAILKPSIYAEWVWEEKKQRAVRDKGSIDWIILRNRLANIHSKNKEKMDTVLDALAKRLAFRQVRGFSERVIFRELFNQGLTLLDLHHEPSQQLSLSHVAARQELRDLMTEIRLPSLQEKVASHL